MKILDCTLRDGGYYTNWDFDPAVVDAYLQAMNELPVDCLEVGYRNNPASEYLGQFGYTPVSTLKALRAKTTKKLAVMLNEKNTLPADLDRLLKPIVGLVDLVRLAVDPKNFDRAVVLARAVKDLGFEVAFNLMYMSKWAKDAAFLVKLAVLDGVVDLFLMVDSFGGVAPDEVRRTLAEVRKYTKVRVGFHGHNNLQLGLVNTLTAIESGVDCVDVTVTGMGRGAGNLNTELLLTYLNKHDGLKVDFNVLGDVVSAFVPLQAKYGWGTNLPYMISGANGIPQKDVMAWVQNRVYSFNSIVRALDNRRKSKEDNARFPLFQSKKKYDGVLIVGGGPSAERQANAICEYLVAHPDTALVFSTARSAGLYADVPNNHYYCLVGNEGRRLMLTMGKRANEGTCILPPYPREMGTDVPDVVTASTYELQNVEFTSSYQDSVTAVALQLALLLTDCEVKVAGYDGYAGTLLSEKEMTLMRENSALFAAFRSTGRSLTAITPSLYAELKTDSIFKYLL